MSQESLIVQEYSKNPVNNYDMKDYTIKGTQWNSLCDDDIVVYMKIKDGVVVWYSYSGNPSSITSAAASLLADLIEGESVETILTWTQQRFIDEWFVVSFRRRRSRVTALLAVRNALHVYLWDGLKDEYTDLL